VTPLRLAHRGDWRVAAENSVAALRAGLAVPGCDGLEFDVRFARDGVPVLLHDATLDRVQGVPGAVSDLIAGELERHGVPTLAEVLSAVGREPFLDIELKSLPTPQLFDVLDSARRDRASGLHRAAVSSFDPAILAWVAERRPGWPRWLNAMDLGTETVAPARDLDCAAIATFWRSIDERGIARAREAGLEVAAWTVRRRPTYARLARLGVIAICVEAAALDG
jgi:glycerophosphoryl diester phosphodiesterase